MPYFVLPGLWLLSVCIGLIVLLFPAVRALGIRIIFISTGGFLVAVSLSVLLPFMSLFLLKIFRHPTLDYFVGIAFFVGLFGGGALGVCGGAVLSRKVTQRMGIQ